MHCVTIIVDLGTCKKDMEEEIIRRKERDVRQLKGDEVLTVTSILEEESDVKEAAHSGKIYI